MTLEWSLSRFSVLTHWGPSLLCLTPRRKTEECRAGRSCCCLISWDRMRRLACTLKFSYYIWLIDVHKYHYSCTKRKRRSVASGLFWNTILRIYLLRPPLLLKSCSMSPKRTRFSAYRKIFDFYSLERRSVLRFNLSIEGNYWHITSRISFKTLNYIFYWP